MENNHDEDTQPYPLRPEQGREESSLENTMPSTVTPQQPEAGDPAQTLRLDLNPDRETSEPDPDRVSGAIPNGFEETIPPPSIQQADEPDPADMTLPTRVAQSTGSSDADRTSASESLVNEDPAFQDGALIAASPGDGTPPPASPAEPTMAPPTAPRRHSPLRWIALIGVMLLVLIAAGSAYAGYQSGINQRTTAESAQIAQQVQEQYELGLQDMEARRFDLARQRFEYVIQYDPSYPGVTEKLAEVLLSMNSTATPTVAPTPTITPTPDTRGIDELYSQAQEHLTNSEWTLAIDTLLALRKADPSFQPVWVDGGLYIAYINRGKDKILRDGDLEGGIFDLTQAEQIGPLDADSKSYQTWARLYITGATFWELDWAQTVYYFAQIAPALPNLRDGSGWTATERLRLAYAGYGDFLAENGDSCAAVEQFELSLQMGTDPLVEEALNNAYEACDGGDRDDDDEQSDSGDTQPAATEPPPAEATQPPATEPPATEPEPTQSLPTEASPTEAPPTEAPPSEEPPATPSP
jgi:tetratricopeptide (TPR) repeat protein